MRFVPWVIVTCTCRRVCLHSDSALLCTKSTHCGSAAVTSMPWQPTCGGLAAWAGQPEWLVQGKDGRTDKLLTIHPGPAMTHLFDWQHACGAHIENTHSANGLAHSSHRAQLCGTYHSGLRVTPAVGEGADSVLSAALCGLQHTLASGACRCI